MERFDKLIPLSLAPTYVRSWGVWEAVRELIANAIDTKNFDIEIDDDACQIVITTYAGAIPVKHLLLGSGTKQANDGKIGQHNEGLKIALLVLARDGNSVEMMNGADDWNPHIAYNPLFEEDSLHIGVYEDCNPDKDMVRITVGNLTTHDIEEIREKHLTMENAGEFHTSRYGEILLDERYKGKAYCGGIFIKNTNLDYGYNFKPAHLSLDRDRSMVSTFDLQYITKSMWAAVAEEEEEGAATVASMIISQSNDVAYVAHDLTGDTLEAVEKELFAEYTEKYEGKVLTETSEECAQLQAAGQTNVIYLGNTTFTNIVTRSEEYQSLDLETKSVAMKELLQEFLDEFSAEMSLDMIDSFNKIIDIENETY